MKPFRYKAAFSPLSFWKSLRLWLGGQEWTTTETKFVVVDSDSPEYDDAPYESAIVFHRDVMRVWIPNK